MIGRTLGFWAARRAYRVLLANDGPLPARLAAEARRILVVTAAVSAAAVVTVIVLVVLAARALT